MLNYPNFKLIIQLEKMKNFLAIEVDRSVSMDIYVLLKKFLFYYPGFDPVSGLQYSLSTRLDTFPSDSESRLRLG